VGLAFAVVAAVIVLRVFGVSLGSLGLLAVVLACRLMMLFMMRSRDGMGRDSLAHDNHHRDCDDNERGRV
jgi:hypothetical protein